MKNQDRNSQKIKLEKAGQRYGDFELTKITEIKELQCVLSELTHIPSGAKIMHIGNDDKENLFCLTFQTLPNSSNGVAHILEHTVLCGSEKYPIKDPFFSMNRRSLNTFMNALTGSDFTAYPAATQNYQDFYHLLEVYLDAVFHPKLDIFSFRQEGHRLEFGIPTDENSPLEYKGIVFNEMKGAMASADARLSEIMNHALFPNITYGHNSGGDPKSIPNLTHQELIDFHQTYYHPSRCLFFFYGDIPLTDHLDFIEKQTLKNVEKLPPLPPPQKQPRFKEKKTIEAYYPISDDESVMDKTLISFGWLTCNILEQEELLALSVIEIFLMETDASPLKRALMDSGLVKQASCFIETDYTEIPIGITLRGCNPDTVDQLEAIIRASLNSIVKNGIQKESIENALHRLEFYRSEITGDHTPFGLNLFFRSGLIKIHGADPEHGLMIHSLFQQLRNDIENKPTYLTDLIQKHLLDNPHFVRVTLMPSVNLAAKEITDEKETLEKIHASLTDDEIKKILFETKELIDFQKKQEDEEIDILPRVTLDDVEKPCRTFYLESQVFENLTVYQHECFTNEIFYADLVFPLPFIAEKDLSLLRLFTILLTQVGAGERNYIENLELVLAKTGGLSSSISLNPQAKDSENLKPLLHLHGKALNRYAKDLCEIMKDTLTRPNFLDVNRIKEVLLKHYTALQSSYNQSALKYAINLSASTINVTGMIVDKWYGLDYYDYIKEIVADLDNNILPLALKLQKMQETVLTFQNSEMITTSTKLLYEFLKENKFFGLTDLKPKAFTPWNSDYPVPKVIPQARVIPAAIAFIGKVFKTIPYCHPDSAALNISAFLFDNSVLHQKIREQGGAYGGGAVCNTMTGTYYFYSYRDPNIASTLQAFTDAIEEIASGNFDEEELEEAKLEMIQGMDSPVSPGSRGYLAYCWMQEGKTAELRQQFRDKVLSLTADDVVQAVRTHIIAQFNTGVTVVFAGQELLEKENLILSLAGKKPLHIE